MPEPTAGVSTLRSPASRSQRHEPLVRRAEAAGYDDLWTGETSGADGFTPLALAAAWTERMRLGTGVVNPFTRGPAVLAQHAAALADASRRALRARPRLVVERDRRALERGAVREAADEGARDGRGAARRCWRAGAGPAASSSRRRPRSPCRSTWRRCAADAAARRRARRRHVRQLPAALGAPSMSSARSREARRTRAGRTSSAASSASRSPPRRGCALARFMFAGLRDGAGLRGVLPLARLGRRDRPDGRARGARRPQARRASCAPRSCMREIFVFGDPPSDARAPGRVRRSAGSRRWC